MWVDELFSPFHNSKISKLPLATTQHAEENLFEQTTLNNEHTFLKPIQLNGFCTFRELVPKQV